MGFSLVLWHISIFYFLLHGLSSFIVIVVGYFIALWFSMYVM